MRMPSRVVWGVIWLVALSVLPGIVHVAKGLEPSRSASNLDEVFGGTKRGLKYQIPQLRGGGRDWSRLITELDDVSKIRTMQAGASPLLLDLYNADSLEPSPLERGRSVARVGVQDMAPEEEDASLLAEDAGSGQGDEPALRRRFLKRLGPQPLSSEQQEEATRLSKVAAQMGTDPTAIIGRVQTLYRHDAFSGGARTSNLVGRIDLPYRGNFLLRVDVPYVWVDPNQSGTTVQDGLSDLLVRTGGRVYTVPGYAFFAGTDITFPTTDNRQLGAGKYTVGPLLATARVFPDLNSFFFAVFQHQLSVGGDPSRQDISVSRLSLTVNTIWADQWWTQIEAVTQVNWERKAKNSMTLEFEGGYRLTKDWGVWARPGVGLWGQTNFGAYEWNMEAGIRRTFTSF